MAAMVLPRDAWLGAVHVSDGTFLSTLWSGVLVIRQVSPWIPNLRDANGRNDRDPVSQVSVI